MTNRTSSSDSHLEFYSEALEPRQMLAGNVRVISNGENLTLIGDNLSNEVSIDGDSNGDVTVHGEGGTNIIFRGVSAASHVIPLTSQLTMNRLKINLRGGEDEVNVEDFRAGKTVVNLGSGNDYFRSVSNGQSFGDLKVNGNSGADLIRLSKVDADKTRLIGEVITVYESSFYDDLSIQTGVGDGRVTVGDSYTYGRTRISTGAGNDTVTFENILAPAAGFFGIVEVNTRGGQDIVQLTNTNLYSSFRTDLGSGDDQLIYGNEPEFYATVEIYGRQGDDTYADSQILAIFHGGLPLYDSISHVYD